MKDLFSAVAEKYARFRPTYPETLIQEVVRHVKSRTAAWDTGTGNGQIASLLSPHFEKVFATDISEKQLAGAIQKPNIQYSTGQAEKSGFPDDSFDLITVAQAVHWFDLPEFYKEVNRVSKPEGILAILGYGLFRSGPEINEIIDHFYTRIIGPYWDPERRAVDSAYLNLPFPFEEIPIPDFSINHEWTKEELLGYMSTWSAVQNYTKANNSNPLSLLEEPLNATWGNRESIPISFPIIRRIGRVNK